MPLVVKVIITSIASFVILFIISKIMGKKQIAELNFVDYAIGISLGSIAAEWAIDMDTPWYHFPIAMVIFFLLDIALTLVSRTLPILKKTLHGSPVVLIENGEINYPNLKRSKLAVGDVLGLCRTAGYFALEDVAYAILETNGDLSILPVGAQRPAVVSDLKEGEIEQAGLPSYLIIDGRPLPDTLKKLGKDEHWLMERLQVDKKSMKNILLASYDQKTDQFNVHVKGDQPAEETK